MASGELLCHDYTASMRKHPYGYALYKPKKPELVKPGVCGYLDESEEWNPIADLTDAVSLEKEGFTPMTLPNKAPDEEESWGAKVSEGVNYQRHELQAGASAQAAGFPAEVKVYYTYTTSKKVGAILMCSNPVKKEMYWDKGRFTEWAKKNAQKIFENHIDAKKRGFFIVTTTFTASEIALNASVSEGKEVSIGFKATVVDVGEISPSSEWYSGEAASGWIYSKKNEKRVAFFGGTWFKRRLIPIPGHEVSAVSQENWTRFRGDAKGVPVFRIEDEHGYDDIECLPVGKEEREEDDGKVQNADEDF